MNAIAIRPYGAISLADNRDWCERFEIRSSSSDRIYIIAKNKKSGQFGCSCPSYRVRRYCKHLLQGCGLSLSQIHGNALADKRPVRKAIR